MSFEICLKTQNKSGNDKWNIHFYILKYNNGKLDFDRFPSPKEVEVFTKAFLSPESGVRFKPKLFEA